MLDRDLFVAKCFFDIGTGESVTTTDNKKYLELVQLNLGKWFLGHFCELAKQQGVSIFSVFSEGFLLCEHEMLSAASGESDHGNYYGGAVWLFSDTLEHPSSMDKLGITISAFAHFAYEYSKHKLVFADIQGSPMTVNGHDGMVLFDLMTHTVTSYGNQLHHSVNDSGIGNHGKDGIKIFMQQHQCDYICVNMGLPSIVNTHGNRDHVKSKSPKEGEVAEAQQLVDHARLM
ncbi:kinase-like domain-containing protein [Pisolithus tinctorius]|nr:kinase-like domain-containing protein [Pisolithus tinctorius]